MRVSDLSEAADAAHIWVRGQSVEVLKNPTSAESASLARSTAYKCVRFMAELDTDDVWVWDADLAIHTDIFSGVFRKVNYDRYQDLYVGGRAVLATGSSSRWEVLFDGDFGGEWRGTYESDVEDLIANAGFSSAFPNVEFSRS